MFVVVLRVDLHLPTAQSLKAKRSVVQSLVRSLDGWKAVAAAEVGEQERWQRVVIGVAVVASSRARAADVADQVERYVWSRPEVEVVAIDRDWSEWDD